jgi:hypothetical protein
MVGVPAEVKSVSRGEAVAMVRADGPPASTGGFDAHSTSNPLLVGRSFHHGAANAAGELRI